MPHKKLALILSLGVFILAASARAAIYSWSGNGITGNWTDSGNWGFAGTPTNGDTVIFPGLQPQLSNTNNIANLTLAQIRFAGAGGGYAIYGNPLAITDSIQATNTSGTNSINTAITLLNQDITINVGTTSSIAISGVISGTVGLIKTGTGLLVLYGPASNSYAGSTTVIAGGLRLGKSTFDGAVPGPLIIGDNVQAPNSAEVQLFGNNQINNISTVTINHSGVLDENGFSDGIGGLNGSGNVFATGGELGFFGGLSYEFDGVISGTAQVEFDAVGAIHVWTGNNTYTGLTYLAAGTLRINGNQPNSPVSVLMSATLGGNGTVGNLLCSGTLEPGPGSGISPGTLTCSNLVFTPGAQYIVDLTGPLAGAGYDEVLFTGTNNLASATLQLLPAITSPLSVGQFLTLVGGNGSGPITGIFNGLPQASIISVSNYQFAISYSTYDVTLSVVAVPGAAGTSAVSSGDGNHSIDPNDCNNLSLTISNLTGTPMTGITATLTTPTTQVLITQPYSPYPDIPANGASTNTAPFQLSTLSNFVCGTPIYLQLSVNSSLGAFTVPFTLASGSLGTPMRYDVSGNLAIPDVGSVESTNAVSNFTGILDKVTVSLYITHPFDSDLTNISLIAPDGTTVLLSSANGGSGQNYGTNCSPDSSRTTFDDAAATSITAGAAPFTGTFRPQGGLSNFIGNATPNGNWRLHIADGFGGSLGTLRCWSLFLYPTACTSGSGACETCTTPIVSSVTPASAVQTNRWFREDIVSSCATPKAWNGFGDTGTNFHYNLHSFPNNTGSEACVTVLLQSTNDLMAGAYLNAYQATNIVANFLADSGDSTADSGGSTTFSCTVPAGQTLLVEVNEVLQNSGTQPYSLYVGGLPCPPPALSINEGPTNSTLLTWPTSAGGFNLEGAAGLTAPSWAIITNEPLIVSNKFTVTNSVPADHFFRLHKP